MSPSASEGHTGKSLSFQNVLERKKQLLHLQQELAKNTPPPPPPHPHRIFFYLFIHFKWCVMQRRSSAGGALLARLRGGGDGRGTSGILSRCLASFFSGSTSELPHIWTQLMEGQRKTALSAFSSSSSSPHSQRVKFKLCFLICID